MNVKKGCTLDRPSEAGLQDIVSQTCPQIVRLESEAHLTGIDSE